MSIKLKDTIYDLINKASKDGSGNTITSTYLKLSGGTMTGPLTMGQYDLNFKGSDPGDIVWQDADGKEIHRIWDNGGVLSYRKDAGTAYTILHSGNSSVSKSGETLTVKINGTTQSLTNTNTTYTAGTGLSLSGTTFNHASSVTAGTAGTSSATSGSTLAVPYVTVNASGHVTGYGTHTHTISGFAESSHNHDRVKSIQPTGTTIGWYRVGTICSSNASYHQNVIISLQRSYNSPENEHYIFAISVGYNGHISITQLCGYKGGQLIDKVRVVYNNSGNCYFDYYMKTSNYNNSYKVTILAGDFKTLQDIALVTDAGGTVFEFTTTNGCKSNYGFTGDLSGNASSASKLGTNAGSATNPVYFSGGVPVACTYSLNKTVPSDAKFTDTNTTYSAGSGLSLSGTTFNHASTVTAGTAGTSSATSGSTLAVPYVTVNATGHVTGYGTHTHTVSGFAASSHTHSSLTCNYNSGVKSNPQEYFGNTIGLKVAMTGHWVQWSDTLWINGYSGGDVKSMCALHFRRDGTPRMAISTQQNTATSYGTLYEIISSYNIANQSVNYANSAGAVAWGNVTGKPSTYSPSSHTHNYIKGPDNRSTNNTPAWYMTNIGSASIYTEFCQTGGANGNYENRTTFIPWGDQSGQRPVQLAFNNSGIFIRTSKSDTEWNAWSGFSLAGHTHSYAASSHTHNYAGSSSAGGDANNSVKWGGYKIVVGSTGSASDTIYFVT